MKNAHDVVILTAVTVTVSIFALLIMTDVSDSDAKWIKKHCCCQPVNRRGNNWVFEIPVLTTDRLGLCFGVASTHGLDIVLVLDHMD